ncbi:DL-glycerol-3-phosphatase [Fusarium chlamydosporum]
MSYTAPPDTVIFDGILFDMDGTIIDSTNAVTKNWYTIGNEIGVDPEVILRTSHGRRTIDTLKILSPDVANWEYVRKMEAQLPKLHGQDAVEIPGARALLEDVIWRKVPWAIVTSGTEPLVSGWLDMLRLPHPEHLVTAESVQHGKPDATCYLVGREMVGLSREDARVLVVEDSPAGIRAGKAAGCRVIGLTTSHAAEDVLEADWVVRDLESIRLIDSGNGKAQVEISNALLKQ